MKIIKKGKRNEYPKYPKPRKLTCDKCKSKLLVDYKDCRIGETVLGAKAYYASCPICNNSIFFNWL